MTQFAWSLSRLKDFERCPKLYWYRRNRKAHPEPPSPAMERGEKIHKMFEKALLEDYKLPGALERFQAYVDEHKTMRRLEVERMWAVDRNWRTAACNDYGIGPDVWCRVKLDVFGCPTFRRGKIIDWKTGQVYGDHAEGGRLYAAVAFALFPTITKCEVEFVYVDQRRAYSEEISRKEIQPVIDDFTRRADAVEGAKRFDPTPGRHCGWCPFNAAKGGPCAAGKGN